MSVFIRNKQDFTTFLEKIQTSDPNVHQVTISSVHLTAEQILFIHQQLPNLTEFNYEDPDLEQDDSDEDHSSCRCHRHDRHE
ncbi:hypothetical protein A0J61_09309 [Choanephora cucurbitarum]|uniref:Uncharacterized protein n=1 Tax=Choanephora cucurbitarum TaxID=101091 RepID=A0A1C7N0P1_9FUNG|nr:hypothetical protein A0J61_09309 [Choanephora cucurbitarum]